MLFPPVLLSIRFLVMELLDSVTASHRNPYIVTAAGIMFIYRKICLWLVLSTITPKENTSEFENNRTSVPSL